MFCLPVPQLAPLDYLHLQTWEKESRSDFFQCHFLNHYPTLSRRDKKRECVSMSTWQLGARLPAQVDRLALTLLKLADQKQNCGTSGSSGKLPESEPAQTLGSELQAAAHVMSTLLDRYL